MKIAVAGTGYVGLSISCLIAQHHTVCAVDLIKSKVDSINNRKSPIQDEYIEKYLSEKNLLIISRNAPLRSCRVRSVPPCLQNMISCPPPFQEPRKNSR